MKVFKFASLITAILAVIIFNPSWEMWGKRYTAYYEEGYINILPSYLKSVLQNTHYSIFLKFSAISVLVFLYLALSILVFLIVMSFIKKNSFKLVEIATCILFAASTVMSLFAMEVAYYCFIPLASGLILAIDLVISFVLQKKKTNNEKAQ